jgi:lysozyme
MRRFAALALMVAIAACSTVDYDFGNLSPSSSGGAAGVSQNVTVRNPRYGDSNPHPWKSRAPWTYAVHGTDVSKYQGSVDWAAAKASGISFVFIKATEGGDRFDERFNEHWRGAKAAGIPRSAYHFYYFCRPAHEQAEWFIRNVPKEANTLPHVLDMEWNHLSPSCKLRPPAAVVHREMRIFLDILTRHYGKRPIVYTSIDFFDDNNLSQFPGVDWWLRSVAAHPDDLYGSHPFRFWQYTGTGIVPGIRGNADINVFNGSEAQWRSWLQEHLK